jgi:hypothetical protein
MKPLTGVIHGTTIQLDGPPEYADGVAVEIVLRPVRAGEGFLRTEGALKDDPHWDAIMEEIQQSRKLERSSADDLP